MASMRSISGTEEQQSLWDIPLDRETDGGRCCQSEGGVQTHFRGGAFLSLSPLLQARNHLRKPLSEPSKGSDTGTIANASWVLKFTRLILESSQLPRGRGGGHWDYCSHFQMETLSLDCTGQGVELTLKAAGGLWALSLLQTWLPSLCPPTPFPYSHVGIWAPPPGLLPGFSIFLTMKCPA